MSYINSFVYLTTDSQVLMSFKTALTSRKLATLIETLIDAVLNANTLDLCRYTLISAVFLSINVSHWHKSPDFILMRNHVSGLPRQLLHMYIVIHKGLFILLPCHIDKNRNNRADNCQLTGSGDFNFRPKAMARPKNFDLDSWQHWDW